MGAEPQFPNMPVPKGHTHAWYEVKLVDARVGNEKEIPWLVTRLMNGPTMTGETHPWFRAHCLN